jgi:aspartyl-tRNA(Asn)/glutamyl-tRNA(Gln) amidotransferase subunit B
MEPAALAALTKLETSGALSATQAKAVLAEMVETGSGDPAAIAKAKGFEQMSSDSLTAAVDEAIAANADAFASFVAGNEKAAGALTGAIMKATKGKADGKAVAAILAERRAAAQ